MSRIRRNLAAAAVGLGLLSGPAQGASWFEKNFGLSGPRYEAIVPLCEDPWVLGKIATRFTQNERIYWDPTLTILGFENVRETAFRPWAPNTIPRRFCKGVAHVSDGKHRPVYFSVIEDGGMIGAVYGVEFCVVGLDRNWAYNPFCRMARH